MAVVRMITKSTLSSECNLKHEPRNKMKLNFELKIEYKVISTDENLKFVASVQ